MHPWLLHSPPITLYGTCLVIGIVAGWLLARRLARRAGIDPSLLDLLMPMLMGAGIAGAYLGGWWTDALTPEPSHGVVLVGAMLAATAVGILFALRAGIPLGVMGDLFAAPIALAIAVGRVGCFCAGCCFGRVSPFRSFPLAVRFPAGSFAYIQQLQQGRLSASAAYSLPVYPVQLYESILCAALGLLLLRRRKHTPLPGERFLAMALGYASIRFALEFLRADNPPVWGGLTFSQGVCAALALAALATWAVRRRYARALQLADEVRAVRDPA